MHHAPVRRMNGDVFKTRPPVPERMEGDVSWTPPRTNGEGVQSGIFGQQETEQREGRRESKCLRSVFVTSAPMRV
jgi:hypothetical protein